MLFIKLYIINYLGKTDAKIRINLAIIKRRLFITTDVLSNYE